MNKYDLLAFVELLQVSYIILIVVISVLFKNYWLLFLILMAGVSETEKRILASQSHSKEKE